MIGGEYFGERDFVANYDFISRSQSLLVSRFFIMSKIKKTSQVSASASSSSLTIQRIKISNPKQDKIVVRKQLEDLIRSYSIAEHISK